MGNVEVKRIADCRALVSLLSRVVIILFQTLVSLISF